MTKVFVLAENLPLGNNIIDVMPIVAFFGGFGFGIKVNGRILGKGRSAFDTRPTIGVAFEIEIRKGVLVSSAYISDACGYHDFFKRFALYEIVIFYSLKKAAFLENNLLKGRATCNGALLYFLYGGGDSDNGNGAIAECPLVNDF